MSTNQTTIDYLLDQLASVPKVWARKMFGEYALYVDQKVVALVCDDTLFVKITEAGREWLGANHLEGFPYPGAKAAFKISEVEIEDRAWLTAFIELTAEQLPPPKPKKISKPARR